MADSFDLARLAAITDNRRSPRIGDWRPHLERWLLEEHIAKPSGEPGRYELTQRGEELVALIARLRA